MLYIILSILIVVSTLVFGILRLKVFKENQRFHENSKKAIKVLVVIYCTLMLLNILLPDGFAISQTAEYLGGGRNQLHAILRLISAISFVVLPIAVFFENRTIRNIAIYFTFIVSILQIVSYQEYMSWFCSTQGKGLASLPISSEAKNFLINPTFRGIYFGIELYLQIIIPVILAINEKHVFNIKNKKEWGYFSLILPILIITCTPIYLPQYLFGYGDLIFTPYGVIHFLWIGLVIGLCFGLYFIFRKKDTQTKWVLLFVLSLSLLMQYNQMFSAISLNIKRLPLQLCNIGAFFVLLSLITKNEKIFNFTVIINVVGVLFAIASPDVDGKGLFYLYNMHFILEHTNVLVVPLLALAFNLFPRLDKNALKDCILLFTIYFILVWALGTMFNAIAFATGKNIFEANWMFMFSRKTAEGMFPWIGALFDINFKIGSATFYPVVNILVYVVFVLAIILLYLFVRLIYRLKDKITLKSTPERT